MSKSGVEISIDVTKIDKSRLYVGKKGTYLTATVFIDSEADQYGNNGMIVHKQTKEESEAKTKTPILGNVKVFWSDQPTSATEYGQNATQDALDGDIPF